MSLNRFVGIGRLGKDPETKHFATSMKSTFSVAISEKWKDKSGEAKEQTEWVNCAAWGKTAELCDKYLSKGSKVYFEGKLQTSSWDADDGTKKYKTEVILSSIQFLDTKPKDDSGAGTQQETMPVETDEIPF